MPAPQSCTACPLCLTRTQVVNGVIIGDNPQLLCIGEGPGVQEDFQGRPFIGPTGDLLAQELKLRGIYSYALSNATRCYPGEDKQEAAMHAGLVACNQYLLEDINAIKPRVILALGAYATRALGFTDPMQTILCHVLEGPMGIPVVVSYHPAAFMRDSGSIHLFELAMYKCMRIINNLPLAEAWPATKLSLEEFKKAIILPE